MANRLLVTPTQAKGWCDYKVQPVVKAVMEGSDDELRQALEHAVLDRVSFKNFLPLPFTRLSAEGRRLQAIWEEIKQKYSQSALMREFVWKFWRPRADMVDVYLMQNVPGHTPVSAREARKLAFTAAGVTV